MDLIINNNIKQRRKTRFSIVQKPKKQDMKELKEKIKLGCFQFWSKFMKFKLSPVEQNKIPIIFKRAIIEKSVRNASMQNEFYEKLVELNEQQKMQKAIRHFYDARLLRSLSHKIDGADKKMIRNIWVLTNSVFLEYIMWFLSWVYQIVTFFEPVNRFAHKGSDDSYFLTCCSIEAIILGFYFMDICLIVYLKYSLGDFWKRKQNKLVTKILFNVLLIIDFLIFTSTYPQPSFRYSQLILLLNRFSRIIRPIMLISYSKELRRNIKGIGGSLKNLLMLFFFYFIVMAIWTYIGNNILSEINQEIELDELLLDYGDFFKLFNLLNMLSILDYYPDIMMPPLQVSYMYTAYFIPYILLFMFLFIPIPLAIVYEGYRGFRIQIIIDDRLKQKEALLACFICLDYNREGGVRRSTFKEFTQELYGQQLTEQEVNDFYILIDNNDSGKISIGEFFNIINTIDENKRYTIKPFQPLPIWLRFRSYINSNMDIKTIIEGNAFALGMFIVTILNCSLIITQLFLEEGTSDILKVIDVLDYFFFIIYSIEFILKLLTYGFDDYFDDGWNQFDFFLLCFQLIFDYLFFNIMSESFVNSFKANRFLRLAKIQKVFRLFRAFRTIKVLSVFMVGLQVLEGVKDLLIKIMICIPVVLKQITIIWIIFYIYAILSVEIFSDLDSSSPYAPTDCSLSLLGKTQVAARQSSLSNPDEVTQWGSCAYADFNSLWGAMLLLLQIFVGDLSSVIFDTSHKMDSLYVTSLFFASFYFISIFLLALLSGLIWEVFAIVEDIWKQQREYELREQELEEKDQQEMNDHKIIRSQTMKNIKEKKIHSMSFREDSHNQAVSSITKAKARTNNFTLDLLADEDQAVIFFSEGDNFILQDSHQYLNDCEEHKPVQFEQFSSVSFGLSTPNKSYAPFIHPIQKIEGITKSHVIDFQNQVIMEKMSESPLMDIDSQNYAILGQMGQIRQKENDSNNQINQVLVIGSKAIQEWNDTQLQQEEGSIVVNKYMQRNWYQSDIIDDNDDIPINPILGDDHITSLKQNRASSYLKQISQSMQNKFNRLNNTPIAQKSTDQFYFIENQQNLDNVLYQEHLLLEIQEYLKLHYIRLKEFSSESMKTNKFDRVFQGHDINAYYITQVKEDLKNFEDFNRSEPRKDVNLQNHQFLIEGALLKGANQQDMRKKELRHFFDLYGSKFQKLREMKMTSLLRMQSRLVFNLHNSLKYPDVNLKFMMQIMLSVETLITNSLLPGCSFCKFIFRDSQNGIFYLTYQNDSYRLNCLIGKIWKEMKHMNQNSNSNGGNYQEMDDLIHVAKDIFSDQIESNSIRLKDEIYSIRLKDEIYEFQKEAKVLQYTTIQNQELGSQISPKFSLKNFSKSKFYSVVGSLQRKLDINGIVDKKNGKFINQYPGIPIQPINSFQIIMFLEQKELQSLKIFQEEELLTNEKSLNSKDSDSNRLFDKKEIPQEQDYFKEEEQYSHLPFPYIIELVKDILQVAQNHEANLFLQLTQLLHMRRCFSFFKNQNGNENNEE